MPPELKKGLLDAHCKLSDYYYKYDESPFYTWAALFDPRISYTKGLKQDYKNDTNLDTYLESSKQLLQDYFDHHYPSTMSNCLDTPSSPAAGLLGSTFLNGSPQKIDFTSRYDDDDNSALEQYFSLPKKNFQTTNPVNWWYIHHDFPRLYRLACSAVAVEHVFSGTQLKPDTICILMLVKHRLRLARNAVEEFLANDDDEENFAS
ncbi:hATC-domain-containing protein [Desarmillaria tabescens]|uniref:HATC-domain-containing protein n=1 Tax=Armillaria tabescens TaxID=1929756 RepID=A0AA39K6Q7_ARMTA|nr:hATC-domain-containing protein [Desarmillaria tabescens]KAK0454239.1 hATC-domain-containing protein [Desarmillaria tabescens]